MNPAHETAAGPAESYRKGLARADFIRDPAQERAVQLLQAIYEDLVAAAARQRGALSRLFTRRHTIPARGLYLWGGVGRGKTFLVDQFFESLPLTNKKRVHFHRFMNKVHTRLKGSRHLEDPLRKIAADFAQDFRVLCFDEFIVNDIADAMLLSGLLDHLFKGGVTLVATSNVQPDDLYKDGLQRDRFRPAIDLIKRHTTVHNLDGDTDYRLRYLDRVEIYFHPHDQDAFSDLLGNFEHVAPGTTETGVFLEIDGREIPTVRRADGVVWFEFEHICGGPRSQNDYLELARCHNTVVVSDIPPLSTERDDEARRFINLIDILYDRNVKFMGSGCCPPAEIYRGTRLRAEFERTASRLIEMQSRAYLAREHLA